MRQVAFSAFWPVMILDDDLLEPGRTRQIGLMTPDAMAPGGLDRQDVRIIAMLPAHAVATLAGKCFVRILRQVVQNVGVTFIARLLARKHGCACRNLRQRIAAIPAVLTKRWRSQEGARDQIGSNDGQSQQNQAQNLWR